MNKKKK
jgi:hypothetical protein